MNNLKVNKVDSGKRIKKIRESLGKTMEQFAIITDSANTSAVNNWEQGYNLPNKTKLQKIAMLGNTSIDWIKWGSLEEYIGNLLQSFEYEDFLLDYPETPHEVYLEIKENYGHSYSLDRDYGLLDVFIKNIFKQIYRPIFQNYISEIISTKISPEVEVRADKPHKITKDLFIARFNSNFNDLLRRKEFKYGQKKELIIAAINLLNEMDEAYKLKQKYLSIEDFFSQNTQTQFQTEKFLSDLSEKYNFPYKANSTTSKFLTKNHNKFNK